MAILTLSTITSWRKTRSGLVLSGSFFRLLNPQKNFYHMKERNPDHYKKGGILLCRFFKACPSKLGLNPWLLQRLHWQSDVVTTRLDPIFTAFNFTGFCLARNSRASSIAARSFRPPWIASGTTSTLVAFSRYVLPKKNSTFGLSALSLGYSSDDVFYRKWQGFTVSRCKK